MQQQLLTYVWSPKHKINEDGLESKIVLSRLVDWQDTSIADIEITGQLVLQRALRVYLFIPGFTPTLFTLLVVHGDLPLIETRTLYVGYNDRWGEEWTTDLTNEILPTMNQRFRFAKRAIKAVISKP